MTDAPVEPDESARRTRELASEVVRLRQRVERVEALALRAGLGLVAAVLVAGLLVPFGTERRDGETTTWTVLGGAWTAQGQVSPDEGGTDVSSLLVLGFGGLTVVVAAMLVTLVQLAGRAPRPRVALVSRVLGVVAVVGAVVVLLLTTEFIERGDHDTAGPGGLVLLVGSIVHLMTIRAVAREVPRERRSPSSAGPRTHTPARFG